jgi:hypothetical protein
MIMSQCPPPLIACGTTLARITASDDDGVLPIPDEGIGLIGAAPPVSVSRLRQAFQHPLDAQAPTGLRCCLKRFKSWRPGQAMRGFALHPSLEVP